MVIHRKISIIEERMPSERDVEELLEWILKSLGVVSKRDSSEIPAKILKEIMIINKDKGFFTLDDLTSRTKASRTTTYHHINKMIKCGILARTSRGYSLRAHTLEETIDEIEYEIHRLLKRIRKVAEMVDREFE